MGRESMSTSSDDALLSTSAGQQGWWIGGFILTMLVSYVLLRLAGSPKRSVQVARTLRGAAVVTAAVLTYLSYVGAGSRLNPGAVVAVIITSVWAARQDFLARK
jgi:hypothetical protein